VTTRYFYVDDFQGLMKLEDGRSTIWADGAWHYAPSARLNISDFSGVVWRELTAAEAERLIAEGRVNGERFTWTEEDFESGGVYFHHGDGEPEE
jgi:hypothetical protein